MITSTEILEKTGLKSGKTLTRWYKKGIIPEPLIRTHPSGRGKIAYWPDWVLDHCLKIIEFRKQGYTINEAALLLDQERILKIVQSADERSLLSKLLGSKKVDLKDGKKTNLYEIFLSIILKDLKDILTDRNQQLVLIKKFKDQGSLDLALSHLKAGYNPVLFFDGEDLKIIADFVVGHILSFNPITGKPCIVHPLLSSLKRFFKMLGEDVPIGSLAAPAPKIWTKHGDALVEIDIALMGINGFELIRETARTIGGEFNKRINKDETKGKK